MSSLRLPRRSSPLQWSAAALAAAALLFLPSIFILFGSSGPESGHESLVVYGGAVLAVALLGVHAVVAHERGALVVAVLAGALNALALVGGFILLLIGGSCSDDGNVSGAIWISGALVYLAGASWGLRARWHAVWLVPVSLLAAAIWVVAVATVFTGSTGMCLE